MKKLKKSPLAMVLAQVKFAPVLQIQKYIPELQEELRKKGRTKCTNKYHPLTPAQLPGNR